MKRHPEERCEVSDAFFCMEESVELLLLHAPTARLLAQVIQLSKPLRRRAWNFLSDPEKWDTEWLAQLCGDLYEYRDRRDYASMSVRAAYPVFVRSLGGLCLCRLLTQQVVLWATVYHYGANDSETFPGWEVFFIDSQANRVFDWYFVARALLLGWERRIVNHSSECWKRVHPPDKDADLCLL